MAFTVAQHARTAWGRHLAAACRRKRRVQFAALFGSVARGTAAPSRSDVDIAIGTTGPMSPLDGFALSLATELSQLAGRDVQVVPLWAAPLSLRFAVVRDGLQLWARNGRAFRDFRAQVLIEHADMEPMAARTRDLFFRRLAEGTLG